MQKLECTLALRDLLPEGSPKEGSLTARISGTLIRIKDLKLDIYLNGELKTSVPFWSIPTILKEQHINLLIKNMPKERIDGFLLRIRNLRKGGMK